MKKVCAGLVLVGLFMVSPLAYAAEPKIGSFDMDRVLNESKRWTKEKEAFEKKQKTWQQTLEKKAAELKALKEAYEKKAGMLSEEARREKEREYQQKAKELERLGQDAEGELKPMYQDILTRFTKSLKKVVAKLGKDGNYTVIVEAGLVMYAADEIDITDQVLKAFDAAKE